MHRSEALRRVSVAPTGHLATVRPNGDPHVVVVTFVLVDDHIATAIDHKPKTTRRLQRLANIEGGSDASFLVDHYDEDWSRLWWVRIDGSASVHHEGRWRDQAISALASKYHQYRQNRPEGPVIAIAVDDITSWSSTP